MKHITFYLDIVSPYAWLAFERLPEVLEGGGLEELVSALIAEDEAERLAALDG